jgi:phenylacetate-CoA ligase
MSLFVQKIDDFHPKFIVGYPSVVYLLARFIEREGRLRFKPKAIITGGEQLYEYQKELINKTFECDTYNNYSSWEVHNIAGECAKHMGLHIAAESIILEVVDDVGSPLPYGSEGRILLSNLHNYAMPLIRYDIGDLGILSYELCSCGRGLPLLSKLSGRTTDVIRTRAGRSIPGIALPSRFLAGLGVEQFQILQESYDVITIKLVLEKEYVQDNRDKLTEEIKAQYQSIFGKDVDITIQFVDQISNTAAGKRRTVISSLPEVK